MQHEQVARRKKKWLMWSLIVFFLWLAGAVILYHAGKDAPKASDEPGRPFQLFPHLSEDE